MHKQLSEPSLLPFTARRLSVGDFIRSIPTLADLLVDVVLGGASLGFLAPLDYERACAYWLSLRDQVRSGDRLVHVALCGDQIVGSGQLLLSRWPNARHRVELQKLLVSPPFQGRGIGRLLMGALHDEARCQGRSLVLLGARRGGSAEAFYRALGYHEVGVVPGYSIGPAGERYDNVTFYRHLN
jgi:GNAT superfamily N-acetyltransferase